MGETKESQEKLLTLGQTARAVSRELALLSSSQKDEALQAMASSLRKNARQILKANEQDLEDARKKGLSASFVDRLFLNEGRIEMMAQGLMAIAQAPDPVGTILATFKRPNGLIIKRVRVPLGVIGVIYESRPNVTADAAGLCLKAGNAVILRGGSDSFRSSLAISEVLRGALRESRLPEDALQMVSTRDRAAVKALLKMDRYIDVLIPRGGPQLIAEISAESHIPLLKHLAGLCHTYIHEGADPEMAKEVLLNAKMRRTGICGATEVLLIDRAVLTSHLPGILNGLFTLGCEVRGDLKAQEFDSRVKPAAENDYDTEFLAPILAVKTVSGLEEALSHIALHGTQHTEAIITEDARAAARFLREVDSAIVMHNTSTQFADGGEFGMGAEMGIATGKLHARGPIGAEQLTTFKYWVQGKGQLRP